MSRRFVASFGAGVLFAVGLGVAGMTNPSKVLGFLDVAGRWDPSLAFVMVGAISVHALAVAVARRRRAPVLGDVFAIPTRREIDRPLVLGAALFGVGWGLSGYCPGPAVASLVTGQSTTLVFMLAMLAGMALHRKSSVKGVVGNPSEGSARH